MAGLGTNADLIHALAGECLRGFWIGRSLWPPPFGSSVTSAAASRRKISIPSLVVTGPDLADAKSRDTRVVVCEMFESARHSVLVVGFAFYGSDSIFEPLADRMINKPDLCGAH